VTEKDRPALARVLYTLGETFNETVSELRAEAYFDALSDLPVDAVLDAARRALRECRFFPRPVELREMVHGSVEDRAELAWSAMLTQVRRVGYYGTPTWPDPETERAALELYGGWKALCENLPSEGAGRAYAAKQFKATFAAYARRDAAFGPALPPSREEAHAVLDGLKAELRRRSLPTGALGE
jgi:hypothetical protein